VTTVSQVLKSILTVLPLALAVAAGAGAATGGGRPPGADRGECREAALTSAYVRQVDGALRAGQDVWGNALLASPAGPTYEGVRRYLTPLLLARAPSQRPLTDSGVHYLPFGQPAGPQGAAAVALHVADGSQILARRATGPKLTIGVGVEGRERYGSCRARLSSPHLSGGYLPILETRYTDASGVRYTQESFAARIPQTGTLVSFVRLTAEARGANQPAARLRFTVDGGAGLAFSAGGTLNGSSVTFTVPAHGTWTAYVAWPISRTSRGLPTLDETTYAAARGSVTRYWQRRLGEGMTIKVPEQRVMDAERALISQNLLLTWRYSVGNPYEEFSFPEGVDVAQVMATHGFPAVSRAILETSLGRRPTPYPNWKMGQKLVGSALYYRLFRDRQFVERVTPVLRGYIDELGRQIVASPRGLLRRERYSSDIPDSVLGLHSQAVAWQGIRSMGLVWEETGRAGLAARCWRLAARLEAGLRRAVAESQRMLPDGSLFIPVRLLDDEQPYDLLTASRPGSYWNLVAPYAFASGLFTPGSPEAEGALAYMLRHGSRLLGLVRAGAYALYGKQPPPPTSGTDQVYGLNVARFLADSDRPDQLVLSLYGHLGAAMTPGTYVAGEAASVAPLPDAYYRAMYLPPNGASNGAFLETLRLLLVHETPGRDGYPRGLELAYATPRGWLRPGGRIAVREAPTSFGPLSFTIRASRDSVRVSIDVPERAELRTLSLRLRLPRRSRITSVLLDGLPYGRLEGETIALPPRPGRVELIARVGRQ
jgi:hypothetical protein